MRPFSNIAAGYDGSTDATVAVQWALLAAHEMGATVTIVHASGLLEHLRTRFSPDELPPALQILAEECAFDERRIRWLVTEGDACSVLLRMASAPINADMLVVGSRGEGKRDGLLLGSTSLEVAEHSVVPVVVVPSNYADAEGVV